MRRCASVVHHTIFSQEKCLRACERSTIEDLFAPFHEIKRL